jgi:hypothetical protein
MTFNWSWFLFMAGLTYLGLQGTDLQLECLASVMSVTMFKVCSSVNVHWNLTWMGAFQIHISLHYIDVVHETSNAYPDTEMIWCMPATQIPYMPYMSSDFLDHGRIPVDQGYSTRGPWNPSTAGGLSIYSGENKYLIHCRFCRFSYLQSM